MTDAVLDASVALAMLFSEPLSDEALHIVDAGNVAISAVNFAEVAAKLLERGADRLTLADMLDSLRLDVAPFDRDRALATAELRMTTKTAGLSLGDRACLALAKELQAPAVTTDRAWLSLDLGVEVRLARPAT